MQCQQNLEFIRQALIDYSQTLAPSARAGFESLALHHLNAVLAALGGTEAENPPGDPRPPEQE